MKPFYKYIQKLNIAHLPLLLKKIIRNYCDNLFLEFYDDVLTCNPILNYYGCDF